ncbi:hypothetical protein ACE193_05575 [Bernardetia sp. OM2101]|uniref:hypothetical protein n=1 Tax=Bernardetia sp. OM2101 TaxID=3344876 RepID=UPI0035D0B706
MNNHIELYNLVKKDFCNLFSFKLHESTLEIITPLVTITDKFVSVFVTERGNRLIVTDGGWISQEVYGNSISSEDIETISVIFQQYKSYYNIQETKANSDSTDIFYYVPIDIKKVELLSAAVFDVANFIVGIVNSHSLSYREKKEKEQRDRFKHDTNKLLKNIYKDSFSSHQNIGIQGVTYNGVIKYRSKLYLLEYITGSTTKYFQQDVRKATINFQLVEEVDYIFRQVESRIAIINDDSSGYQNNGFPIVLQKHLEKSTSDLIFRTENDKIFNIIPSLN